MAGNPTSGTSNPLHNGPTLSEMYVVVSESVRMIRRDVGYMNGTQGAAKRRRNKGHAGAGGLPSPNFYQIGRAHV